MLLSSSHSQFARKMSTEDAINLMADAGFDGEQVKLVSENTEVRYAVKFKVLAVVGRFWGKLFG